MARLSPEELKVIARLEDAWNSFVEVAGLAPGGASRVRRTYIHALQHIVMARLAVRAHPAVFSCHPHNPPPPSADNGGVVDRNI